MPCGHSSQDYGYHNSCNSNHVKSMEVKLHEGWGWSYCSHLFLQLHLYENCEYCGVILSVVRTHSPYHGEQLRGKPGILLDKNITQVIIIIFVLLLLWSKHVGVFISWSVRNHSVTGNAAIHLPCSFILACVHQLEHMSWLCLHYCGLDY